MDNYLKKKDKVWSLSSELIEAFDKKLCYDVHIDMTLRCKGGCIFCFMSSVDESTQGLSNERLFEVIEDSRDIGAKKITWYGGEPLLRDNWEEIVTHAHQCGLENDVRTGGQPLHVEELAKRVIDLHKKGIINEISLHIDSIVKADFMKARDTYDNYYEEVMMGINNLIKNGYSRDKLSICIVQTKVILNSFKKTVDWAIKELGLPLKNLKLTSFRPCGFGKNHTELECTIEELKQNYKYICELNGWDINNTPCLHECSKYYCCTMLHIEGNGEVVPCSMMHKVVGNVNQERFMDIFQKHKAELLLFYLRDQEIIKGKCYTCENRIFCFGCRANSHNFLGDATKTDPKCWVDHLSELS